MTELLSTDDCMDEVEKRAQDKLGMACQGTSAGGREHQLFAGDGCAGLCLHTWAGAGRVWGLRQAEERWKQDGGG